jgi:hypothetical protein
LFRELRQVRIGWDQFGRVRRAAIIDGVREIEARVSRNQLKVNIFDQC